ncbi:MAG: hypothetical protein Terrestrivirus11_5 [Terrestrivirus sp.]|uniref:Minor capsid protein P11 C-terminal conserved region domain-containing protein n=1 Tax=Terrestrivirus sp. TaxID=2487775 RepID=A0A3G4ZQR3_9VIRU|nr:MAG: hypothetical protein Terrestrivirus11_5 [Terrestrivirus sp.]
MSQDNSLTTVNSTDSTECIDRIDTPIELYNDVPSDSTLNCDKKKYNTEDFLPKVMNLPNEDISYDWFEPLPENITVKNRHLHLISPVKYLGVNTGDGPRNYRDLRSLPTAPKITVSPWLQSTIEPDKTLKAITSEETETETETKNEDLLDKCITKERLERWRYQPDHIPKPKLIVKPWEINTADTISVTDERKHYNKLNMLKIKYFISGVGCTLLIYSVYRYLIGNHLD